MSENIKKTVLELQQHLQSIEDEAADTKRTINSLCKKMGAPILYTDVDTRSAIATGAVRPDQYYGKALATVAREILEARQAMNLGPASVAELYDKMVEGGYVFDTNNADNAKRVLRISLTKNSTMFHKLPGGAYGLLSWYPAVRNTRRTNASRTNDDAEEAPGDDEAVAEDDKAEVAAAAATNGEAATPRRPR